jgi:prevent-host-death family protein
MLRISSAELQRQFGLYSEKAQREPVTVTRHGRDSVVLMSIADYERLKSFDTREAYSVFDLPDDLAEAILAIDLPEDEDTANSDAAE